MYAICLMKKLNPSPSPKKYWRIMGGSGLATRELTSMVKSVCLVIIVILSGVWLMAV